MYLYFNFVGIVGSKTNKDNFAIQVIVSRQRQSTTILIHVKIAISYDSIEYFHYPANRALCTSGRLGSQPEKNSGNALRSVRAQSNFAFAFSRLYLQPLRTFSSPIASRFGHKKINNIYLVLLYGIQQI